MSTVDMRVLNSSVVEEIEEKDAFSKLVRRISVNDVYWCNLGDITDQYNKYMIKKCRPCIILSKDIDDNSQKNCFTILPIKTYRGDNENNYFVTEKINLGDVESLLCMDQIRPINRRSIHEYIGTITAEQRAQIDAYLTDYLDIKRYDRLESIMQKNGLSITDIEEIVLSCCECETPVTETETCQPIKLPGIDLR